ncbi:MAG: polyamine ABC transporter ATP-binding protein [Candidatus Cryptobacteroides sp.]|nr:polyamine ABC transporter ATP-binding protein [Candidatus Cryptobacteroides sp.]
MANDIIIDIKHLCKSFGDKKVLEDINLYVRRGEFITLLGPSGCGKTTLLRQIAGFIAPDSGCILLEGKDISSIPPYKRPLNTVFQRYALFPHLDVYDNIAFGLKLQKLPKDEIDKRVQKMLKMVSMTDYDDRSVESLSGGQQQRVAIARALVNYPKVLLLDEPLAALDLKMRKDMQIELKELHKKMGITFIYVTHDQEEALTLSDTVVVLNEGRIQQIGTPTDIYNEPCNSFVADFIGESTILNGRMIDDYRVEFMEMEFECVDKDFGKDVPVDVVIRPEDVYIMSKTDGAQFTGTVKSCIFKGVHYEMFVETSNGYELMVQDYNGFEVGSLVGLYIKPSDIQVMRKERTCNTLEATLIDETHIDMLGARWECLPQEGFKAGDSVRVTVDFDKVDLLDHQEDGQIAGEVRFLLYKGNHYHLTIDIDGGGRLWVDTDDIWDKGDLVGVNIRPQDLNISRCDG